MLESPSMSDSFKTILVGYDGFEGKNTLPAIASALAKEHGAKLHLVHVASEAPRQSWWSRDPGAQEAYEAELVRKGARLEEMLTTARKNGVEATTAIRKGTPDVELIREAVAVGADLVIVTDEFIHRKGKRGFGAVTMKLLRYCPVPVLAKRDPRKFKHRNIVASLDLESTAGEANLNEAIINMAAAVAGRADAKITLFHAWSLWGEQMLRDHRQMQPEKLRELLDETKDGLEAEATRLSSSPALEGLEVGIELRKGEARDVLPEFVEAQKVDIVVMGTIGRSGLRGAIMGNTAERILNGLSCSVLAVKPKGFRSPISGTD